MTRTKLVLWMPLLLLVACAGSSEPGPPPAPQAASAPAGAPTPEELAAATYSGIVDEPIRFVAGEWEGAPYSEGGAARPRATLAGPDLFRLTGDLDGDGVEEAVVHVTESGGGTGNFGYLVAMGRAPDGTVVQKGIAEIGDRISIRGGRVDGGKVSLDIIQEGPGDAACCKTQLATRTYELRDGALAELSNEVTGTASLAMFEGREWVLTRLTRDEAAPADPEVTLVFREGGIAGSSGCNRFTASVEPGETPKGMKVGPMATTQMACPPPAMELETRVQKALAGATGWGVDFGRLRIDYQDGDDWRTMTFVGRDLPTEP